MHRGLTDRGAGTEGASLRNLDPAQEDPLQSPEARSGNVKEHNQEPWCWVPQAGEDQAEGLAHTVPITAVPLSPTLDVPHETDLPQRMCVCVLEELSNITINRKPIFFTALR